MHEHRQLICVTCPVGCAIEAIVEDGALVGIQGQSCKRGLAFVREEISAPKRVLTTTVRVRGGQWPLVPVRSAGPLPKELLRDVVTELRRIVLEAPISEHQVIVPDVLGTGVDIISSRDVLPAE